MSENALYFAIRESCYMMVPESEVPKKAVGMLVTGAEVFKNLGRPPSSPNFSQQIRGAKIALLAIKEALTT